MRILLVDDEPSIVKMLSKRLEIEGFDVRVAMDGEAALQQVEAETPDLVILDLMLPKLNGYEVCAKLKQDPRFQRLPVLMVTARTQEHDEELGLAAGADGYLHKPFKAQELIAQIKTLVSRYAQHS